MAIAQVLVGHTSEATAHETPDYPYGYVLRCVRREWLEFRKNHGYRFVTMTSNPKRVGLVWNKPKASTYDTLAVMYLDEHGHVHCAGLHVYASTDQIDAFVAEYGAGLQGPQEQAILAALRRSAVQSEARRAQVMPQTTGVNSRI